MSASDVQRSTPHRPGASRNPSPPARGARHGAKVLPAHARGHNRALVLQRLFHDGAMSRADLARETGLTRVTISDLVAELIAEALVVEKGTRAAAGPGKPAILVDIDHAGHEIIGMDLSGPDAFVGAVMTLDGSIVARQSVARPADGDSDGAIVATQALAASLTAAATRPILGVGVGTPGVVAPDGTVLSAPKLGWSGVPLQTILSDALGLAVVVGNDANAAVLAERTFGGAGGDLLLVKIGRGLGSGLLAGGSPMIGSRFAAGEIGHVTVGTDGGPECACGKVGCLEAWVSVPSLTERIAAGDRDSVLRDAGERLGIALAPVVGALDLSEIVLSGPEELLGGVLAQATVDTLRARTFARFQGDVRVRMTAQGQDIVLRGAAVMVLSGRLGVS